MLKLMDTPMARTSTDMVFNTLYDQISTLKLLPGTKMSEAEVASRMGVSRQPVRDAFNRLGNMGLLTIRPQRATEVRGFSLEEIQNSRFIRLAVELEVIKEACAVWDDTRAEQLAASIDAQQAAIDAGQNDRFHEMDYDFHRLICELGGLPLAFDTIERCKQTVDRLCMLSLGQVRAVTDVITDHRDIAQALSDRDDTAVRTVMRRHLRRLDDTITRIHTQHAEYFE
ncbi:GntR family transcriptional regulator [Marinovum sp.]|uniref:GntR family transcriptional regulator n=1 Tax=Marinovum sp. TaxID=2024839 RepID=UPI002B271644|nr:GntR family transcriptional regulator [Marinovum sp.]